MLVCLLGVNLSLNARNICLCVCLTHNSKTIFLTDLNFGNCLAHGTTECSAKFDAFWTKQIHKILLKEAYIIFCRSICCSYWPSPIQSWPKVLTPLEFFQKMCHFSLNIIAVTNVFVWTTHVHLFYFHWTNTTHILSRANSFVQLSLILHKQLLLPEISRCSKINLCSKTPTRPLLPRRHIGNFTTREQHRCAVHPDRAQHKTTQHICCLQPKQAISTLNTVDRLYFKWLF